MVPEKAKEELAIFEQIVSGLAALDTAARIRLLQSVATFLEIDPSTLSITSRESEGVNESATLLTGKRTQHRFSESSQLSPKDFLLQKEPRTDVERVTCLAYYLTHHRDTPQFKTLDISRLNMEAAHQKFTNPAHAVKIATAKRLLAEGQKGQKQISAIGERFVEVLPNRESAKEVLQRIGRRKGRKTARQKKSPAAGLAKV